MALVLTEEQELLQHSAREFLAIECPMEWVRKTMDDPSPDVGPLWKKMSELGWLGLTLPEAHGGAGLAVNYDPAAVILAGFDPIEGVRALGPWIGHTDMHCC